MKFAKGRGRLGRFNSVMGMWRHEDETTTCERSFAFTLEKKFVELRATWDSPKYHYEETCLFGVKEIAETKAKTKSVGFWSFTSDGKRSEGTLAQALDIHKDAIAFEAQMPSGYARQVYWPADDEEAFYWVVESRTKKGWNRFVTHTYRRVDG